MFRNKIWILLVLCLALLTGCAQTQQPAVLPAEQLPTKPQVNYKTTEVIRGSFDLTLSCNSFYVFPNPKTLVCAYANAILAEDIVFPDNATFQKGDVIATYTFDVSQAELERLELEYYQANRSAAQQIESYESRIAQYTQAATAGGIDGQIAALQLSKAQNELKIYKEKTYASLRKQSQALEEYRELFTPKTLVAPEDGMVLEGVSFNKGTVLKENAVIFSYTTGETKLLQLNNPFAEFLLLATPGMEVTVSRGDQLIHGTIVASPTGIADNLNNQYVYISSPDLDLLENRSYYNVECNVLSLDNMLLVDSDAIHQDSNGTYVMVLENGQAVKREVMCGLEDDGMICILDGLEEGQLAILNY